MDLDTLFKDFELTSNSFIDTEELFIEKTKRQDTFQGEIEKSDDVSSTNFSISESKLNSDRLKYLDQRITPLLLSYIRNEDYEFGQRCDSINLVEEQLKINEIATQNWFNKLYLKYYSTDESILLSLLRIVEYLDKNLLFPTGQTMALASLSHKNNEVKEMGIRIFENWCCVESYDILKNLKVDTVWLQEYIEQVKKDLEEELCLC